jgi:hypothetical protein
LTQEQLNALAVGVRDLPGYRVSTVFGRGADGKNVPVHIADISSRARTKQASCQPLRDDEIRLSAYQPTGIVEQLILSKATDEHHADVAVLSYQPADAPKVLADLRAALRTCASYRVPGDSTIAFKDPHQLPSPHLGDEAIEYRITMVADADQDPTPAPVDYILVRKGSLILWAQSIGIGDDATIPMAAVTAQLAKLPD